MLAAFAVLAGAVIRCILLSGAVPAAESNDLSLCFYICFAAGILLFAASSFMLFSGKTDTVGPSLESGMFLPCILGAAGVFCDFIYQCLSCYDYVSRTAYPAANRIVPMIACAVFALLSCAYFIVLSICSRSRSFDLGRLRLLCFTPLLWAFCHVLLGLTEYESAYNDTESALKYITLIFGLLFFFLLAAQKEDAKANGSLAFSDLHIPLCALFVQRPVSSLMLLGRSFRRRAVFPFRFFWSVSSRLPRQLKSLLKRRFEFVS